MTLHAKQISMILLNIPEDIIPVFFDKIHLMKWNANVLTNKLSIFFVPVWSTMPLFIFLIPILHKKPKNLIT